MEKCLEQLSLNDMRLDAVEITVQLCNIQEVLIDKLENNSDRRES